MWEYPAVALLNTAPTATPNPAVRIQITKIINSTENGELSFALLALLSFSQPSADFDPLRNTFYCVEILMGIMNLGIFCGKFTQDQFVAIRLQLPQGLPGPTQAKALKRRMPPKCDLQLIHRTVGN